MIGCKVAWSISATLVFKILKRKQNESTAESGHCDVQVQMLMIKMPISQKRMNVFWSDMITMFSE